jgi:SAM-dependent methyltransferase
MPSSDNSSGPSVALTHNFANPMFVISELAKGRTLFRALFHHEVRHLRVSGRVLDIGGKTPKASYYAYIKRDDHVELVVTDVTAAPGVLALDVQRPFPIDDASFDIVLAFNLFEHVFAYEGAPSEIVRILKPGGKFVLCVPFLHEYHADPHDYFRFTAPALLRIWEGSGLSCTLMRALGEGLLSYALTKTASLVLPKLLYRLVAPLLYLVSFPLDRLIALRPRLDGLTVPERFALGYFAIFEKPR